MSPNPRKAHQNSRLVHLAIVVNVLIDVDCCKAARLCLQAQYPYRAHVNSLRISGELAASRFGIDQCSIVTT